MNSKAFLLFTILILNLFGCQSAPTAQRSAVAGECPVHHVPLLTADGFAPGVDHVSYLQSVMALDRKHEKDLPKHLPIYFAEHRNWVFSVPLTEKYCPICEEKWRKLMEKTN